MYHLYMKSKKVIQINLFIKQKNRLTDIENKVMVIKEKGGWGGIN